VLTNRDRVVRSAALVAAIPIMAVAALLALPNSSAAEEGCYFANEYFEHGACSSNDCWWWDGNQRCRDGGWCACGSCAEGC
jgi:hypothetical protein